MRGGKNWALSLQHGRRLKPRRLVQVVNGPLSADTPLCPKPFLIFGEGMSWLLQLSQAQLFTFPLSEQSCLRPAAWWRVYVWAGVCPSASMHGYWQGALATQLILGIQLYKQLYTSKLGAVGKKAASCFWFHCGQEEHFSQSDEAIDTCSLLRVLTQHLLLLVQEGSGEPEEKVLLMYALLHDWCFSPLAWASIYFITTLFTPWLCTSWGLGVRSAKRPYWLHTETVSYDEWTLAKSNSEINRPAAVSLGLWDGWINMVIKWEVATMSLCQVWQADPRIVW